MGFGPSRDMLAQRMVDTSVTGQATGAVYQQQVKRSTGQPVPFDGMRPRIVRFLTYDQVRDLIKGLRDRSKIRLLIPPAAPSGASR